MSLSERKDWCEMMGLSERDLGAYYKMERIHITLFFWPSYFCCCFPSLNFSVSHTIIFLVFILVSNIFFPCRHLIFLYLYLLHICYFSFYYFPIQMSIVSSFPYMLLFCLIFFPFTYFDSPQFSSLFHICNYLFYFFPFRCL